MVTAPLNAVLVARLYGFSHVGLISGFLTTIHHVGGGFWTFVGGAIFDRTGSYGLAFVLSALMALIAVFCAVFIREERHYANGQAVIGSDLPLEGDRGYKRLT
jgi:predicted MFS family arabinose efflux permease